eukprot:gnl/Chilomastix_caulleri/1694.p1 GENE.gnl/Chilomastix_caulleri/1694~~gnl/Chilomastix_caulleri/1694.p1  ORF type:complete len:141 (+),score=17.50 gnl/Chilomastix_caulleri/1694:70-492(+)
MFHIQEMPSSKTRSGLQRTSLKCPSHRQVVTRYCYTCEKFICEGCMVECKSHPKTMLYCYINDVIKPGITGTSLKECNAYGNALVARGEVDNMINWSVEQMEKANQFIEEHGEVNDTFIRDNLHLDSMMGYALLMRRERG